MYNDYAQSALLGVFVDDIVFARSGILVKAPDTTATHFPSNENEPLPFAFAGSHVQEIRFGFHKHQVEYTAMLLPVSPVCSFEDFNRVSHQLAWLVNTRPNILSVGNRLSVVTAASYTPVDARKSNSIQR